jgi:hypothetical protein
MTENLIIILPTFKIFLRMRKMTSHNPAVHEPQVENRWTVRYPARRSADWKKSCDNLRRTEELPVTANKQTKLRSFQSAS